MPTILALQMLKQEDLEFMASLGYTVSSTLASKTKPKQSGKEAPTRKMLLVEQQMLQI